MSERSDIMTSVTQREQQKVVEAARLLHPDLRWTTFKGDVLDRETYIRGNTQGDLIWRAQRLEDVSV